MGKFVRRSYKTAGKRSSGGFGCRFNPHHTAFVLLGLAMILLRHNQSKEIFSRFSDLDVGTLANPLPNTATATATAPHQGSIRATTGAPPPQAAASNATPTTECTREELLTIRKHLNPEFCPTAREFAYFQFCSLTQATKCVDASNWLEDYYRDLRKEGSLPDAFLGLSVGCNKGFDALNTLRMGTHDTAFTKKAWKQSMELDGAKLSESVCNQDIVDEFQVSLEDNSNPADAAADAFATGEMHCFEPMPPTVKKLQHAAKQLGYDQKGFKVVHAGVSKTPGTAWFATVGSESGVENVGMDNCEAMGPIRKAKYCTQVPVVSLKDYVKQHIDGDNDNDNANGKKRTIHHLSIDVEGFDADVLSGTGSDVLKRVEYLEFEYNWMGSWKDQHLYDVVTALDQISMTCYWAGTRRLWRITGCWMRYYDIHTWSNVACVNRNLVPKLAAKMEDVFRATLGDSAITAHTFRNPVWRRANHWMRGLKNDPMLATEPHEAMVSTEYL
ncbi:unnamed protein product [Pseudo-nitzschia multistriata]|uniref:Methyltransferase FkbM domain-containing protein n=1 Tax=Pseudo-nitzschia multistriata TaxID=183589 RepID=A0A448ZBE2_9STRA|nr:unnamed protein product [Pseudo-nitzschia multistriata]